MQKIDSVLPCSLCNRLVEICSVTISFKCPFFLGPLAMELLIFLAEVVHVDLSGVAEAANFGRPVA